MNAAQMLNVFQFSRFEVLTGTGGIYPVDDNTVA